MLNVYSSKRKIKTKRIKINRKKSLFYELIGIRLKKLADELNQNRQFVWGALGAKQPKYYLGIVNNMYLEQLSDFSVNRGKGIIYCLDHNFIYKAVEIIGEENIIKFLK